MWAVLSSLGLDEIHQPFSERHQSPSTHISAFVRNGDRERLVSVAVFIATEHEPIRPAPRTHGGQPALTPASEPESAAPSSPESPSLLLASELPSVPESPRCCSPRSCRRCPSRQRRSLPSCRPSPSPRRRSPPSRLRCPSRQRALSELPSEPESSPLLSCELPSEPEPSPLLSSELPSEPESPPALDPELPPLLESRAARFRPALVQLLRVAAEPVVADAQNGVARGQRECAEEKRRDCSHHQAPRT